MGLVFVFLDRFGSSGHLIVFEPKGGLLSQDSTNFDAFLLHLENELNLAMGYISWDVYVMDMSNLIAKEHKLNYNEINPKYQAVVRKSGVRKLNILNELRRYDNLVGKGRYDQASVVIAIDVDNMRVINAKLDNDHNRGNEIIIKLYGLLTDCVNNARDDIMTQKYNNSIISIITADNARMYISTKHDMCVIHRSGDEFVIKAPTLDVAYQLCCYIENELVKNNYNGIQDSVPDHIITITMGIGGSLKNADLCLINGKAKNAKGEIVADCISMSVCSSIIQYYYIRWILNGKSNKFVVLNKNDKQEGNNQCKQIIYANDMTKKATLWLGYGVVVFFVPFVIMAIFLGLFVIVKQNLTSHTTMEFAYLGYFIGGLVAARMVSKRWIKYGATGKKGTKALQIKKYQESAGVFEKAPELINLILFPILSATIEWRFGKDVQF